MQALQDDDNQLIKEKKIGRSGISRVLSGFSYKIYLTTAYEFVRHGSDQFCGRIGT